MAGRTYIYVRSSDSQFQLTWDAVIQKLTDLLHDSQHGFNITKPKGENWIVIDLTNSFEITLLVPLIANLTPEHVYGFEYQTIVDGIAYWHYFNGELLRHFDFGMYGEERTWNKLVGEPEPWELDFFSEEELESEIGYLEDEDEEAKREILDIYNAKRLKEGSQYPLLGTLGVYLFTLALKIPGGMQGFEPERDIILEKTKKLGFLGRLFRRGKCISD